MNSPTDLDALNPDQLRALARRLMTQVDEKTRESHYRQTRIDQLTHELSVIKRLQFGRRSEQFTAEQLSLLDEAIDEDLAALQVELDELRSEAPQEKPRKQAKRLPLPPQLPRTDIRHEPTELSCSCGCQRVRIGEDISEKLDYTPGVFTVERHIRGKWACKACETLIQAPVPPHVIDKGIPTNGLLAQVLVAKYGDHLPLYRQEHIFGRAGLAIPQSTLGGWVGVCGVRLQPLVDALHEELLRHSVLHADETPVQMLSPGKGKTHRAYLWAYTSTQFAEVRAVVYEFADGRSGEHARAFLGNWRGKLVVDDFSGYKAGFKLGITEIGCMAQYPEYRFMSSNGRPRLMGAFEGPNNSAYYLCGHHRCAASGRRTCRSHYERNQVSRATSRSTNGSQCVCTVVRCTPLAGARLLAMAPMSARLHQGCVLPGGTVLRDTELSASYRTFSLQGCRVCLAQSTLSPRACRVCAAWRPLPMRCDRTT